MSRKKAVKAERRYCKRAGFGRQHAELGALAYALEEVKRAPREVGYAVEADVAYGVQTRRRVRRERWNRMGRMMRRMLVVVGVYGASLAAVLLLVGAVWGMISD